MTRESVDSENNGQFASIYPNPFTNNITIYLTNPVLNDVVVIKVYNMIGEEILSSPIINQTTILDASHLPSGMYTYQVTTATAILQTGKLISARWVLV